MLKSLLIFGCLFGGLSLFRPAKALGQGTPMPSMPTNFDSVDVYLITVEAGQQVYALFGHSILRVVDRDRNLDMNFNWGIFDYRDPNFVWKFYQGDLDYQLGITDFRSMHEHYLRFERRGMVQEKIALTARQKAKLMERLVWNSKPENIVYKYSQFYDNCATKPRDFLDEALSGTIREAYEHVQSTLTFRDLIREHTKASWWVYLGLDMLTNSELDHAISLWDEMFLPKNLRAHLRDLPAFDDHGDPIPGTSLLSGSTVLIPIPPPPPELNPYALAALILGLPLILVALAMCRRYGSSGRESRLLVSAFGALVLLYGLWSALWGTIFLSNWMLSDYNQLQHNALQWLYWPIDWLLVALGARILMKQRLANDDGWWDRLGRWLAGAHILALLAAVICFLMGYIQQDILLSLASFGLLALIIFTALVFARSGGTRALHA